MKKQNEVAKIENSLILKGRYSMPANEQKVMLFMIGRVNPIRDKAGMRYIVPAKELIDFLKKDEAVKWKKPKYLNELIDKMITRRVRVNLKHKGQTWKGWVNFFQHIEPLLHEGKASFEFMFSQKFTPFILQLEQYVKLELAEIVHLKGQSSIRLYEMLKAQRDKEKKHKPTSYFQADLDELKSLLGLDGKYPVWKDLNRWVLKPAFEEINRETSIKIIDIEKTKTGRKVTGVHFIFTDQEPRVRTPETLPDGATLFNPNPITKIDFENLTESQKRAVNGLKKLDVNDDLIKTLFMPSLRMGIAEGYEDKWLSYAWQHTKKKSKAKDDKKKVAVFVNWWRKGIFTKGEVQGTIFSKIVEYIAEVKKADNARTIKGNANQARAYNSVIQDLTKKMGI